MKKHLNTLFITREGCWLSKDGETVKVNQDKECILRVPLHNLEGIVTLGWDIGVSPHLMGACAERGISISFCSPYGKYLAGVQGFMHGNVLLRREQYRQADDEMKWIQVSREMIGAKIANGRTLLMRAQRTYGEDESIQYAVSQMASLCKQARMCTNGERLRGLEGNAAEIYFSALSRCQRTEESELVFDGRNRRPPQDCFNALLSFLYCLLCHDAKSALESAGLDSAVGFLHRDRPGRPSMALDLMEEFRSPMADRMTLTLLNRKQISSKDFDREESGAVFLKDDSRKVVITSWQEKKAETIIHPYLQEKTTIGLLVHLQAQLLARYLRGDVDAYAPFIWK
ncbi:MAG: type I-C CRISPR-associated endonuclease Cas1c [Akkermansia sp.]